MGATVYVLNLFVMTIVENQFAALDSSPKAQRVRKGRAADNGEHKAAESTDAPAVQEAPIREEPKAAAPAIAQGTGQAQNIQGWQSSQSRKGRAVGAPVKS